MAKVYLDYNATSPLDSQVWIAMSRIWSQPLNASSIHSYGREARAIVEEAREKIFNFLELDSGKYNMVFTGSGTESNNLAICGLDGHKKVISAIEHPSVANATGGDEIAKLPVDNDGVVLTDGLEEILKAADAPVLVSVMLVNNETGVIQPLDKITEIAHRCGAIVHTDAVQAFGKMAVSIQDMDVDMLTISAHKFGGPQGVSALVFKKGIPLKATQIGGGQESGFRSGTENVVNIHGFGKAVELLAKGLKNNAKVLQLRDGLEDKLKEISPDIVIFGENVDRVYNTSCILMPGVSSETQLINFDMDGFAVSAGSACSSGKVEASRVLKAMGVNEKDAKCAVRVSLGYDTKQDEINKFAKVWEKMFKRLSGNRRSDAA